MKALLSIILIATANLAEQNTPKESDLSLYIHENFTDEKSASINKFSQISNQWKLLIEKDDLIGADLYLKNIISKNNINWLKMSEDFSINFSYQEDDDNDDNQVDKYQTIGRDIHLQAEMIFKQLLSRRHLIDPENKIAIDTFCTKLMLAQGSSIPDYVSTASAETQALRDSEVFKKLPKITQLNIDKSNNEKDCLESAITANAILELAQHPEKELDETKILSSIKTASTLAPTYAENIFQALICLKASSKKSSKHHTKFMTTIQNHIKSNNDLWVNARLNGILKTNEELTPETIAKMKKMTSEFIAEKQSTQQQP